MTRAWIAGIALSLISSAALALPVNVALGAGVTLNGTYGVLRPASGWAANPVAAATTLTDGIYRPAATVWNDGSVWWDAGEPTGASAANSIEVALGGPQIIVGLAAQADDNDSYRIEYWNGASWVTAWDIPAVFIYGLQARPNPAVPTAMFVLGAPITTDRLRFTATGGDGFYSVAEIQAFTPEPGTLALLGLALAGIGFARRRKLH